jgi:hypothetical protein
VFGVNHFLEIEKLVVFGRELLNGGEWANLVLDDSPVLLQPYVRDGGSVFMPFQRIGQVQEGFFSFPNTDVVKHTGLEYLMGGHGCMNAAAHKRGSGTGSDGFSDFQSVLELIAHHRKTYKIRGEFLDIPRDSVEIEWIAKIFIDVEESGCVAGPTKYSGKVSDTIVEANLGVQIGVNEEDSHLPVMISRVSELFNNLTPLKFIGRRRGLVSTKE